MARSRLAWFYGSRHRTAIAASFAVILLAAAAAPAAAGVASLAGTVGVRGGQVASAGAGGLSGKAVVLVVDRVSAQEFPSADTPYCRRLAAEWSSGLMVTRSADSDSEQLLDLGGEYATLGAGERANGTVTAALNFDSAELFGNPALPLTSRDIFRGYTGAVPGEGTAVCLGWQAILKRNEQTDSARNPGSLGSALSRAGLSDAVLGNEDAYGEPKRFAALICAGGSGVVQRGSLSDLTVVSRAETGITRTDYGRLTIAADGLLRRTDMLVVDTGDTGRIDRQADNADPAWLTREKRAALREVDRFVKRIAGELDLHRSMLLVISPGAPQQGRRDGNFLTPIVAAGKGFERGLLVSTSTREDGIVNNIDFLPTVLGYFGLKKPSSATGAAMTTAATDRTFESLRRFSARVDLWRKARWPATIALIILTLFVLVLTVLALLSRRNVTRWPARPDALEKVIPPAACVVLAAPLSFLAASIFTYGSFVFPLVFCTCFSVAVGIASWLAFSRSRFIDPVSFVCLLTAASILVDLFTGSRFAMFPLIGSGVPEGLRFYGLTNVVTGILMATTVWGIAGVLRKASAGARAGEERSLEARVPMGPRSFWAVCIVLALVALVIGLGALGADIGGFIAAVAAFLIFAFCVSNKGLTRSRLFAAVPLVTAAAVGLVIGIDSIFYRTHESSSVTGGASRIFPIIGRKLAILFYQVSYVLVPALALIVAVVAVALWMRRRDSFWTGLWVSDRFRMGALYALLVGGLVGLVFNDTGMTLLGIIVVISVLVLCDYATTDGFPLPGDARGEAAQVP